MMNKDALIIAMNLMYGTSGRGHKDNNYQIYNSYDRIKQSANEIPSNLLNSLDSLLNTINEVSDVPIINNKQAFHNNMLKRLNNMQEYIIDESRLTPENDNRITQHIQSMLDIIGADAFTKLK